MDNHPLHIWAQSAGNVAERPTASVRSRGRYLRSRTYSCVRVSPSSFAAFDLFHSV